jgi:hypothetical protein
VGNDSRCSMFAVRCSLFDVRCALHRLSSPTRHASQFPLQHFNHFTVFNDSTHHVSRFTLLTLLTFLTTPPPLGPGSRGLACRSHAGSAPTPSRGVVRLAREGRVGCGAAAFAAQGFHTSARSPSRRPAAALAFAISAGGAAPGLFRYPSLGRGTKGDTRAASLGQTNGNSLLR